MSRIEVVELRKLEAAARVLTSVIHAFKGCSIIVKAATGSEVGCRRRASPESH